MRKPTTTQIITLTFLAIILVGAFLLILPISSRGGGWTPPLAALFTAVSALCVTGLVIYDTFSHWSLFGQVVILVLIQIGGIGFMSIVSLFSLFMGRKIGLYERQLIMQASGIIYMGGVVRIIKRIILGTMFFQGIGFVILSFRFVPLLGWPQGLYNALFHAVSAFCNAGFDLMGRFEGYSSLALFAQDPAVLLVMPALYIIGGIGFLVWNDIYEYGSSFNKYTLHTKIVMVVTATLLLISTIAFFFLEANHSMAGMNMPYRWLNAFLQGSAPRTAGFNTAHMQAVSEPGRLLTMFLMFIGGSPGSTAGGLKTTTLLVLVLSSMHLAQKNKHIALFRRRLSDDTVQNSNALFVIFMGIVLIATFLISVAEPLPLSTILFEVISALSTAGMTMGITAELGGFAQFVIIVLMFVGRVGLITLVMALFGKKVDNASERVVEKVLIG